MRRYQQFFCEENIWWLAQEENFLNTECHVLFIFNRARSCMIWQQKSAEESAPVFWDYHVILLVYQDGWRTWDLDTRMGLDVPLSLYLRGSFPHLFSDHNSDIGLKLYELKSKSCLDPNICKKRAKRSAAALRKSALESFGVSLDLSDKELLGPTFRVIPASQFVRTFSSDRRHMRSQTGEWYQQPPRWEVIGAPSQENNLQHFIQMDAPFIGEVMSLEELEEMDPVEMTVS